MDVSRFLMPTPAGVLVWLSQSGDGDERRLFEHILLAGRPQRIDMHALGASLGKPVAAIARTLFSLNRHQFVSVLEGPPSARQTWSETGLAGLANDLVSLATPGQKLLLATDDGLSLARVGWSAYEADVMATRRPRDYKENQGEIVPLHIGSRCFYLSSTTKIDRHSPSLLKLGYRLLQGCVSHLAREAAPC